MAQFHDDLFSLRGRVLTARPGVSPDFVVQALNDQLRKILDARTFWADLLKFGILPIPDPYNTGTINVATGSSVVNGTGTVWPVSDYVSVTIPAGVPDFGYAEVTPSSMNGITENSLLYVDAAGVPEVAPVVEVGRATFVARFAQPHAPNCTVTQSSMANRQLRLNQSYPIFTVAAVTSTTSLILTLPWGGPPLSAQGYEIKVMYVMLASDLKSIIGMKDEQTGFPVRLHVPLDEADTRDPKRMLASGNPYFSLIDLGANDQGNMLYEMWPAPSNARQFSYAYWKQWPEPIKDTDRPPPFINPSILFYGAVADAKMMRTEKGDPYYDPQGSVYYKNLFNEGLQAAKNADEAKCLEAMKNPWWRGMRPGNYDAWQLQPGAWDFGGDVTWW